VITSVSQVNNAAECLRLWAFGAIDKVFGPQSSKARDGEELHAHIRNFVQFDMPFEDSPLGRLAALAQEHLPTRADDPRVEQSDQVTYGAYGFTVKPDLMWLAPCGPIVADHKLVDNFRFAMTPLDIRVDFQVAVYCYYAMRYYGAEECTALWIYYRRPEAGKLSTPDDIRPVEVLITYEDTLRVLRTKQKLLDQMANLKKDRSVRALDIVGNRGRCEKYGAKNLCSHFAKCFPTEAAAREQQQSL
jgi:hypothetical protein